MKKEVNRPCFICGGTNSQLLFTTQYRAFDYPGDFQVYQCKNCKLLYNSPRLDDQAIAELYSDNYYFFHRRDKSELQRMILIFQQTIGLLVPAISGGGRVLEIGSAKGYFLAVLKKLGWTVFGVEISSAAGKFTREKFNIPVFTGTLEEYAAQPIFDSWPLVLAFDVLEHVTNPDNFIAQLNRVTQAGGSVIIMTPNGSAANIGSLKADWPGFNPFHIFIFTPQNLIQLLNKHGFDVQKIFSYNNTRLTRENVPRFTRNFLIVLATKFLKKIRLINWLKNIRLKYWSFLDERSRNLNLEAVVTEIKKQGNYFMTPDSQARLAKACAGDNLVVIAKKL